MRSFTPTILSELVDVLAGFMHHLSNTARHLAVLRLSRRVSACIHLRESPSPPPPFGLSSSEKSTAVMDYLAKPPPAASSLDASLHGGDVGSDNSSNDAYLISQDLDEERAAQQGASGHDRDDGSVGSARQRRPFSAGKDAGAGPSAGQAVAVAALATDYGAWLKRLAVRLRRATPAGERFVRLRSIGPAVTGEQVC